MSDLSITSKLGLVLATITNAAKMGLDDEHRYAEARQAYEQLKEAFPDEFVSHMWARAREAFRAGRTDDPYYWLKVFGNESDRRYASKYRKRPKVKKKRAAYMKDYRQRAEVKKRAAEYIKTWRENRRKNADAQD